MAEVSDADSAFISSSLVSRLGDEDPAVILAVLELGPKVGFLKLTCQHAVQWNLSIVATIGE